MIRKNFDGSFLGAGPRAGASEEESLVSLRDFAQAVGRRLWVVVLVPALLLSAALGYSYMQVPVYESSIKVLVSQEQADEGSAEISAGNVQGLQQLTETMAEAIHSRPVAEAVIRELELGVTTEAFLDNMSVRRVEDTQFIEVSYRDTDPVLAQEIADATGRVFSEQVSEISPGASSITATVWERASEPGPPVSPDPIRNAILALMLGLMAGVGLALLMDQLSDDWRSPEEVEQVSGAPTFGVIPAFELARTKRGNG